MSLPLPSFVRSLRALFSAAGQPGRWFMLLASSLVASGALTAAGVPAALLLGPMFAAIVMAASGRTVAIPNIGLLVSQGLIGCLVARSLPLSISGDVLQRWPLFVAGVALVLGTTTTLGWLMMRWRLLPGSTIVWGLSPGAASAMTLLAARYGADAQLVAVLQYVRVLMVAALASAVAHWLGTDPAQAAHAPSWLAPVDWPAFVETMALAALLPVLARRLGFPSGTLLWPMVAAVVLEHTAGMRIELPIWLMTVAYAIVGWRIGLGFTRPLLAHAIRVLPSILGCTALLIACCALLALLMANIAGVDILTAYLALSPGGLDSVAIIAASNPVDMSFVMATQVLRFVVVLLVGPLVARAVVERSALSADKGPHHRSRG